MALDTGMRLDAASPRAKAWAIAAIILVLNWTIPGALQFNDIAFEQSTAGPGISSEARGLQPGTLPRALPQDIRCETSVPKPHHKIWASGAKPHALPPGTIAATTIRIEAVPVGASSVEPRAIAHRAFDPRAPPPLMA